MKTILKYFPLAIILALVFSCKKETKVEGKIAEIEVDAKIDRFDRRFAEAAPDDLPKLKVDFPYLFPKEFSDSLWLIKIEGDTLQAELEHEVLSAFPNFDEETVLITNLFKHIRYYFPAYPLPKVVTVISEVDYNTPIILSDSLLFIGLDNYLGNDHKFYSGLPNYISKRLRPQFLASDIAQTFANKVLPYPNDRSFLARMVYHGKLLYLKDKLLPIATEAQKMRYLPEELQWASANEEQIWRFFIENGLLYSTDLSLDRNYLNPAPFSKFGLELDNESPDRLGRYMGWQIVKAFGDKNPDVSLHELLKMPADAIFKQSKYKPNK